MSTQRVLVVDDEPRIRMTVRGYLEADGFRVGEAADGRPPCRRSPATGRTSWCST